MSKPFQHVRWVDLKLDGSLQEVVVLKEDPLNEDLYYIAVNDLDTVDRGRVIKILADRDANRLPLYELMSHHTLGNGMNALEFFHQLVKVRTKAGKIFPVTANRIGVIPPQSVQTNQEAVHRGPGRPPKVTTA